MRCEDPTSLYNFGWSHGKEVLGSAPDTHKGSYYANPLLDAPTDDPELMRRFPGYCRSADVPGQGHQRKPSGRDAYGNRKLTVLSHV